MTARKPKSLVETHPNAIVGASAGSVGILLVYVLGAAGVKLDAEVAGAIVIAASSVALFIGRNGLKAVIRWAWLGKKPG